MPNGQIDLIDYCKGVVNDSPDYQGHDQRWSPPDSWRYARQFQLVQARQRITDAMSMRHKGGDLQAIEYVAQHTFGVTLVANDIDDYKRRIILGPKEKDGSRRPLLDPSSKHPKSRLVGHASSRCKDGHRRVRSLRRAPSTSSPLVAGQGLHGGLPHKSSAQAPSQLLGDSLTRPIRREPRSSRVS
jgi:hypothetical protein